MVSNSELVIYLVYRIVPMLFGVLIIWWGYRLFMKGMAFSAGELSASSGGTKFDLKNAAPGTFLFVLGTIIIVVSLFKGVNMKSKSQTKSGKDQIVENQLSISDTLLTSGSELINVDSIYNLAKFNLDNKRFLEAYKFLYWTKGLLNGVSREDVFVKRVDNEIKNVTKILQELIKKNEGNYETEDIKSVNINDIPADSTN